ncbi:Sec1 domain containing protein 1 [Cichlidogyrus casuarinus]|uniref:Sec1 domain containing protein 1 n=1 Tax=Cichlidogyrus casuarinus TaxID=1844966 RepID=A0ABD2PX86_9PLAT
MENLAQASVEQDCVHLIKRIYDQYCSFICLEDDLFVLADCYSASHPSSFYSIQNPSSSEESVKDLVNRIVEALHSVFATLGVLPIIRCPSDNIAELAAMRLDSKLRDSLRDSNSILFSNTESIVSGESVENMQIAVQRPLLIILDRAQDISAALHHSWSYQSLVHDVFDSRLNRVALPSSPDQSTNVKAYDLSTAQDKLWREFKDQPFETVPDAVQQEIDFLKNMEKEIGSLKDSFMGESEDSSAQLLGDIYDGNNATSKLTSAIETLPQLMERKRCLDLHTNLASLLAAVIKDRRLDFLNDYEQRLMMGQKPQDFDLGTVLGDPGNGTAEDKLRVLLVAALQLSASESNQGTSGSSSNEIFALTESELDRLGNALQSKCPELDMSPLEYVRRTRKLMRMVNLPVTEKKATSANGTVFNKLVSHGSAMLEGMKSFVSQKSYMKLTRIVQQLMENKTNNQFDNYRYFDPKLVRHAHGEVPRSKQRFNDCIVFVVGGGSYTEYHDMISLQKDLNAQLVEMLSLQQSLEAHSSPASTDSKVNGICSSFLHRTPGARKIIYGSNEMLTSSEFLKQLQMLGRT